MSELGALSHIIALAVLDSMIAPLPLLVRLLLHVRHTYIDIYTHIYIYLYLDIPTYTYIIVRGDKSGLV